MGKNTAAKVMAWLALIAIVSSILGTGILYIFGSKQTPQSDEIELTPEQLEELQNLINSQNEMSVETGEITQELE